MTDTLESVNGSNAKAKSVNIRIFWPEATSPSSTMTVFAPYIVSTTGHYTIGEDVIFGDATKREGKVKELKKSGHTYRRGYYRV